MENKVAEAMSKKETLKARALTAETTKQLNESITSMVRITTESLLCEQETAADMRLISYCMSQACLSLCYRHACSLLLIWSWLLLHILSHDDCRQHKDIICPCVKLFCDR